MSGIIRIVLVSFVIGFLIGALTRSRWALLYPAAVFWVVVFLVATDESSSDMTWDAWLMIGTIVYELPAIAGTLLGIGGRKAVESRG